MRIAITGSAGIGKSTLAKALSEKYNLTLINEHYTAIKQVQYKSEYTRILTQIFQEKAAMEARVEKFVTDRCPIDLIKICINQELYLIDRPFVEGFVQQCVQALRQYDFVVVLPWNSFPLTQAEDMCRNMDSLQQLHSQAQMVGFTHMWINKMKVLEIPQTMNQHEQRLDAIDRAIRQLRPELIEK
jgi:adenylate kinase family enzyme